MVAAGPGGERAGGRGSAVNPPDALPRVSVIVPCRNEGHRIAATLESLFAQTRLPDEIVVADGRSHDDTVAQAQRFGDRGVPLRIVINESRLAGGGRNAATRAASHGVVLNMDAGNTADPGWLEAMARAFAADPELDLLAGIFHPAADGTFGRVCGAVCFTTDVCLPSMKRDEIEMLVPKDFVPGGMCMAYRRRLWERAGGFCEWARKGQDRLFGYRARRLRAKVGFTLDAVVSYHMSSSLRALASRHYFYNLWTGRMGIPSRTGRLVVVWTAGLLAAVWLGALAPLALLGLLPLVGLYLYARAWRKLRMAARATGQGFGPAERGMAVLVLLVHDAACVMGWLAGRAERLIRPRWRRATDEYLEHGR